MRIHYRLFSLTPPLVGAFLYAAVGGFSAFFPFLLWREATWAQGEVLAVLFAEALCSALLAQPCYRAGVRRSHRRVLLSGMACLSFGFALTAVAEGVPLLLVARLASAAGSAALAAALSAVADGTPPTRLATALSLFALATALGAVTGPLLFSLLLHRRGFRATMAYLAAVFLFFLLLLLAWGNGERKPLAAGAVSLPPLPRGRPHFYLSLVLLPLLRGVLRTALFLLPFLLAPTLAKGTFFVGALFSLSALCYSLGTLAANRLAHACAPRRTAACFFILICLAAVMLLLPRPPCLWLHTLLLSFGVGGASALLLRDGLSGMPPTVLRAGARWLAILQSFSLSVGVLFLAPLLARGSATPLCLIELVLALGGTLLVCLLAPRTHRANRP